MEFKLPFPTLQDLAVLEIAHSLMYFEASDDYLAVDRTKALRESLKKVDRLEILEEQKLRIREVVKGTSDHLYSWYTNCRFPLEVDRKKNPKLQFDIYGCVNEVGMARDYLKKRYTDKRYDNDLKALIDLLTVATSYALLPDVREILLKILKLSAKDSAVPQLNVPEFEINQKGEFCVVYRFVNQQMTPISSYTVFYDSLSTVHVSGPCVRITLHSPWYNSELFQSHWNLFEPSKRIPFVKSLILTLSSEEVLPLVVDILKFLDPDSQCSLFESLHGDFNALKLLRCFLVWPFQEFFLSVLESARFPSRSRFQLFRTIVEKLDIVAFKEMLMPLWESISLDAKSELSRILIEGILNGFPEFKDSLKELSRKNALMYERVATDLNLPLTYLGKSRKRKYQSS